MFCIFTITVNILVVKKINNHDYMNTKLLIENIIEDLVNDASISKIMLKAQAIAYALDNDDF